jgi:hypothetical protein
MPEVMNTLRDSNAGLSASVYNYNEICDRKIPIPALHRGWLHSRELRRQWNVEGIAAKIGDQCWFSYYHREESEPDPERVTFRPFAIAGFWPSGGFVELAVGYKNQLEVPPRCTLLVHAESPARAEALMNELIEGYGRAPAQSTTGAKIGFLSTGSFGALNVERTSVTAKQTVPREQIDLYYGDGAATWVEEWIRILGSRQYGLTLLAGAPGTGKTTLVRSLAHWLAASHLFYFMPASRFQSVDSGDVFDFLTEENRQSRLRKVLILEDAETVLRRRGQDNSEKVATLLNLTDGMLGDVLGLHVICTMNSDVTDLDPALLRPGRLVAQKDFRLLTQEEIVLLADALHLDPPGGGPLSLAEFFNPASDTAASPCMLRRVMGFNAAPLQKAS